MTIQDFTKERLASILTNYVNYDAELTESCYVLHTLRKTSNITDEEISALGFDYLLDLAKEN